MLVRRQGAGGTIHRCLFPGLALLALSGLVRAQDANLCDLPGEYPDLIVGDITSPKRWGTVGGITAYSFRTDACNLGTCQASWIEDSNLHPVIAQNLFRLENGRFEQIGQGWLKHGFATFQQKTCSPDCISTSDNEHLGVDCSDAYSANLNGYQPRMGPKSEVNPVNGAFLWPPAGYGLSGDVIYKRLQAHDGDLDPALHPAASYFVEVQYVARDDATGGNQHNNVSYRPVRVFVSQQGNLEIDVLGETVREAATIEAWRAADPTVLLSTVDADGRFYVGSRATDLGGGTWRYEYAIQNLNSFEAARSFGVALHGEAQITNIGFHDVDYHSGEPYDGTDWPGVHDSTADTVTWSTATFQQNPNANALRWGTLYNFRFDADYPPVTADVVIGLFRGALGYTDVPVPALVPYVCTATSAEELGCADGIDEDCDRQPDCADLDCCTAAACLDGIDADGDLVAECDCNDTDGTVWSPPGEARDLVAAKQMAGGAMLLSWTPPIDLGASAVSYSALRSPSAADFVGAAVCLALADPTQPAATDGASPAPGLAFHYLVRVENACPAGLGGGPLGSDSTGSARAGLACP